VAATDPDLQIELRTECFVKVSQQLAFRARPLCRLRFRWDPAGRFEVNALTGNHPAPVGVPRGPQVAGNLRGTRRRRTGMAEDADQIVPRTAIVTPQFNELAARMLGQCAKGVGIKAVAVYRMSVNRAG